MKKKIFLLMLTMMMVISVRAQFEKDTWYFNASVTSLNLSHSKNEGTRFGMEVLGGTFLTDNLALMVGVKGDYRKYGIDETGASAQIRYYLEECGFYGALGAKLKYLSGNIVKDKTLFFITPEAGYTFFLGKNLTIEPAVYYDLATTDVSDWSKFGFKIGFGFYFK